MSQRRAVLRWGLAGALGVALPAGTVTMSALRGRRSGTPSQPGGNAGPRGVAEPPAGFFRVPLPIPAILRPVSTRGGVDRYEIRQVESQQEIRPGTRSPIWGYHGTFPGPTIEARSGRPVAVTHHNELPVPTVVHLHGGSVPAASDGYPTDLVIPGRPSARAANAAEHARHGVAGIASGSRTYVYPNEQPAATLWYHDHRMDFTGPQIYRGLAGFYLIRDAVEQALALPDGERDMPLLIADRMFSPDGSLFYPARDPQLREPGVTIDYHHSGVLGDTVTVNGVAWPFVEVDAGPYRLRLLNASNARVYRLSLDPPPPGGSGFIQIGSDGGLLARPVRHDSFVVSPGERYDMVVDFSGYPPGTQVVLKNGLGQGPTTYVMRFDVVRPGRADARIPDVLRPENEPLPAPRPADRRFSFFSGPELTGLPGMINMRTFDVARIDARPRLGTTEIWDITADPSHPVHLHLARFRVLSRDGGPPAPQDSGWKDTVFVPQGGVRLAVTFSGYRGKYVFHCHNLEHGDSGMMANMEVV